MRQFLRIAALVTLAALIIGAHRLGGRKAKESDDAAEESTNRAAQSVLEPPPPQPSQELDDLPVEAPPPESLTTPETLPITKLIDGYTADDAVQRLRLSFLHCLGGPNDGRLTVFPIDPVTAQEVGSMAVLVVGLEPYVHAGMESHHIEGRRSDEKAPPQNRIEQKSIAFGLATHDRHLMGVETASVYALETKGGAHRLSFVGSVALSDYARFLQADAPASPPEEEKPKNLLELRNPDGGIRRLQVFPVRCVGGPADGKEYPLLVDPAVLWNGGLTAVAVFELRSRPILHVIRSRKPEPATNFIGHASIYELEELRAPALRKGQHDGFQLKFRVALDAQSYLDNHHPTKDRKP